MKIFTVFCMLLDKKVNLCFGGLLRWSVGCVFVISLVRKIRKKRKVNME